MKNWMLVIAILLSGLSQAQLKLNKETGLFERKVRISNNQVFMNKLTRNKLAVNEDLSSTGSFTHMVNDVIPVVIHYEGRVRDEKYVFTGFQLKTGADEVPIKLEDLPAKQRKLWIPIINEKLAGLNL